MPYQVLARKYRPQRFADVAGQEHVTRTLLNALQQGRVAHGYIFSGHRGIGKTTIARILAQALNCRTAIGTPERPTQEPCGVCDSCQEIRAGNSVDVLEIDAATNRGIDEVRELREAARYRPARDKYKIWILDEAHQITDAAFNALLKTLEEPPEHVIFMMATTQPEDIPQTIRSRCQHFSFHAVKFDDILTQLRTIASQEDLSAEDAALSLLAEAGDGSMRDALSIMDQAIASAPLVNGKAHLVADQIRELMGSVPNTVFERLMEAISAGQTAAVVQELNTLLNAGNSPAALARQFVRYLRNALMARIGGENTDLLQISADERARAARSAMLFSEEDLTRFLQVMLRTFDDLNYRQEQRFHLELGLVKLVHLQRLLPVEELLSQLPPASGSPTSASGSGNLHRGSTSSRPAAAPAHSAPAADPSTPPVQPAPPRPSPFEADRSRKITSESNPEPRSEFPRPQARSAHDPDPAAPPVRPVAAVGLAEPLPDSTDGALALAPDAPAEAAPDLDRIREAICAALLREGHETAANLIHQGQWTQQGGAIQVELAVRKTMLSLMVNAEAETLARKAMRALGTTQKIAFLPGENGSASSTSAPAPPISGSAQSAALDNPLVRRAQELFHAEIRSVLDLRDKS
ncbi:MAG TPA: DNA polymerase III subunit gamma/tau [Acidobacteriaceae bacterium]|jgi:DNA polymerase-3 subunit gamma/tau|nr:DNA polymerase III subunit gamma/tau [Acidobacteriaceae bacterium]